MESYHCIACTLPFSEGFLAFDGTSKTIDRGLSSMESDEVALDTRLMLQRKYFQNSESIHFRKVVKALETFEETDTDDLAALRDYISEMRNTELEIGLGNGELRRETHQNIEDSTYGFLLHGDLDRARRVVSILKGSHILALRTPVLNREKLLLSLENAIRDTGLCSLSETTKEDFPSIIRFSATRDTDLAIRKSPQWSNLVGRDIGMDEIEACAEANSLDDNMAIAVATLFLSLLASHPLDSDALRKVTAPWTWLRWGDFSEAAAKYASFRYPAFSTCVQHEGGLNYAQIKLFENVEEPFVITEPQLVEAISFVTLGKLHGEWKVLGFVDGRNSCRASQKGLRS